MLMSESSPRRPRKPLSRAGARNAVVVNQLATPGLGSLMAGRWVAGIGQLLLALAGFGMLTTWLLTVIIHQLRELTEDVAPQSTTPVWLGKAGALLFVAAWV